MKIKGLFESGTENYEFFAVKTSIVDIESQIRDIENFIVTDQVLNNFKELFEYYNTELFNDDGNNGVWISGPYNTGKKYFLKILYYLFENNLEVNGFNVLDFLIERGKITDNDLIYNMNKSLRFKREFILFNMYSKYKRDNSILDMLYSYFNEYRGFCSINYVAEFEKQLISKNLYEEFKKEFETLFEEAYRDKNTCFNDFKWESKRNEFPFVKRIVEMALLNIGFEESKIDDWLSNLSNVSYSIDDFCSEINEYCGNNGEKHQIIFLIDELGELIIYDESKISEFRELIKKISKNCSKNIGFIISTQFDSSRIFMEESGLSNTFFNKRLFFDEKNKIEIIKGSILSKNQKSINLLREDYENSFADFFNSKDFNDINCYNDSNEFIEIYPFLAYQFDLFDIYHSIRYHSRSYINIGNLSNYRYDSFRDVLQKIKDFEYGSLISFNLFYEVFELFLDYSYRKIIFNASKNENLSKFDVEVLKVIMLLEFSDKMDANLDKLTVLLIPCIFADLSSLKIKIKKSLDILLTQEFIYKNDGCYFIYEDNNFKNFR